MYTKGLFISCLEVVGSADTAESVGGHVIKLVPQTGEAHGERGKESGWRWELGLSEWDHSVVAIDNYEGT